MKRYFIVAAGATAVVGFAATAYFCRRKRQRTPPVTKRDKNTESDSLCESENEKDDTLSCEPSARHSVKSSTTVTPASSPASSRRVKIRHPRQSESDGSQHISEVKKLYQEGVDSFESALDKWEKATIILKDKQPNFSAPPSNCGYDSSSEDSDTSIEMVPLKNFKRHLDSIMHKAQHLQEDFHDSSDYDSDVTIGRIEQESDNESDVSDSAESYMSAAETVDAQPSRPRRMRMYNEALKAVGRGEVTCRKLRTEMLLVDSEKEFLAKVHCLRQGFEVMLENVTVRNWLIQSTRSMLECIIHLNDLHDFQADEVDKFKSSFDKVIAFCSAEENWENIMSELCIRKVYHTGFYDIIFCFLLLDAFDDLENPPYAVTVVLQNRFLANRFKVKAVNAAVWSVLKAKQSQLSNQTGFIAHMYEVCSHIMPTMTWGFLGPDTKLQKACIRFKSEVLEYMQFLFSFDHVRYTKPTQMADDLLGLTKERITTLMRFIKIQRREKLAAEKTEAYQQRMSRW